MFLLPRSSHTENVIWYDQSIKSFIDLVKNVFVWAQTETTLTEIYSFQYNVCNKSGIGRSLEFCLVGTIPHAIAAPPFDFLASLPFVLSLALAFPFPFFLCAIVLA